MWTELIEMKIIYIALPALGTLIWETGSSWETFGTVKSKTGVAVDEQSVEVDEDDEEDEEEALPSSQSSKSMPATKRFFLRLFLRHQQWQAQQSSLLQVQH